MLDDDLERRLTNWARWYWNGHTRGRSTSSIYHQAARSRRWGETSMPVINGEAVDTDTAVHRLDPPLRDALRARYLDLLPDGHTVRTLSQIQVAAGLLISYPTYRRRVLEAQTALRAVLWRPRRAVA